MEVSRINAVSPMQIDWRKLTAKEIIEYNNQGVEVPTQYLQWAQEFRQSLTAGDTDDTTYESAESSRSTSTSQVPSVQPQDQTTSTGDTSTPQADTPEENLTAKEKRNQLEEQGYGLIPLAYEFKNLSNTKGDASEEANKTAFSASTVSQNSIESLDSYMSGLMSEINDLKSKISSESKKNKEGNIAKVNRLRQQLQGLGQSGQNVVASYSVEINNLMNLVNAQVGIPTDGIDYGNETVSIGEEVEKIPLFGAVGKRTKRAGDDAISKSQEASNTINDSMSTLNDNQRTISSHVNDITVETGVSEASAKENGENGNTDSEKKESDKSVKTAQNDGTDTTAKNSTSLDEILKAKIRKGEKVDNQSA